MIRPNLPSICLLAALLVPLAGCQTPPPHSDAQAREHEVQTRDRDAQAHAPEAQARDREVQVRDREVQAREHKAQVREREPAPRDFHDDSGAMFSDRDVAAIRDYYRQGHQPGMTAGRIIKLRQGEAYPFGYTWVSLPRDLEARLSPLPKGYIRVLVGTDIGILDIRTRVVVDLLENLAG